MYVDVLLLFHTPSALSLARRNAFLVCARSDFPQTSNAHGARDGGAWQRSNWAEGVVLSDVKKKKKKKKKENW